MPELFTVAEIAKRFRVKDETVRVWIDNGLLPATNVASASATRKRWRISEDDLAEFRRRRSNTKPAAKRKRRQRERVTEYV